MVVGVQALTALLGTIPNWTNRTFVHKKTLLGGQGPLREILWYFSYVDPDTCACSASF